jgi:putative DNA methylase
MRLAAIAETTSGLVPLAVQDAPSFIERQFPVGRLSAEAYKERKAGSGQTLTALGSYWKGRKPLILVRAVVLGCLLPATKDASADLDIFLKLMAMDDAAFGRRFDGSAAEFARLFRDAAEQVATNRERVWRDNLSADELRRQLAVYIPREGEPRPAAASPSLIEALGEFVGNPRASKPAVAAAEFASSFPEAADDLTEEVEVRWRWRTDISLGERQAGIARAFATLPYAERLKHVRRPEECNEADLLAPIWREMNRHLGTNASHLPDLVEQLGIARFGHRPKVADTFCGAGSIPFEAARIGCDVYASDLNPIACVLTWGAFNIIGASPQKRAEIGVAQKQVAAAVDAEIRRLGIEHNARGDRAKAYLYCLETRCPKTGWMVPMAPSWVISKTRNVVAKLVPDQATKRYAIEIHTGVSAEEMEAAEKGTVQGKRLVHPMNPERSGVEIKTIRGDYRDAKGNNRNRLRVWEKHDFMPHPDDIFQERLYCIQWFTKRSLDKGRPKTFFAAVTEEDLARERKVEAILWENLARWQDEGLVPDMPIEPGDETTRLVRERGWTHWHHLFGARALQLLAMLKHHGSAVSVPCFLDVINFSSRLCRWRTSGRRYALDGSGVQTGGASDNSMDVFSNQALNTLYNYSCRSFFHMKGDYDPKYFLRGIAYRTSMPQTHSAVELNSDSDIFLTDPPYADAINYTRSPSSLSLGCARTHRLPLINGRGTRAAISL